MKDHMHGIRSVFQEVNFSVRDHRDEHGYLLPATYRDVLTLPPTADDEDDAAEDDEEDEDNGQAAAGSFSPAFDATPREHPADKSGTPVPEDSQGLPAALATTPQRGRGGRGHAVASASASPAGPPASSTTKKRKNDQGEVGRRLRFE